MYLQDPELPLACSKLPVSQSLSTSFHLDLSSSITRFEFHFWACLLPGTGR